jgi:hypothetical protein
MKEHVDSLIPIPSCHQDPITPCWLSAWILGLDSMSTAEGVIVFCTVMGCLVSFVGEQCARRMTTFPDERFPSREATVKRRRRADRQPVGRTRSRFIADERSLVASKGSVTIPRLACDESTRRSVTIPQIARDESTGDR